MDHQIYDKINEFEIEGQRILDTYTSKKKELTPTPLGRMAGAYLETEARKRYSSRLVSAAKKSYVDQQKQQLKNIETEGAEAADKWLKSIVTFLKGVSRITKSISIKGNSSTLTRKFNEAFKGKQFETKIKRGLTKLQELKGEELILNSEIKNILKEQKIKQVMNNKTQTKVEKMATPKKVFISYVHENNEIIDRIQLFLEKNGITVWRDIQDLYPGERWKEEIRKAIQKGDFFLACFSKEYNEKTRTHMNEELRIAVDELRLRPKNRIWFIPIKLNKCEIPDWPFGANENLQDFQWVGLYNLFSAHLKSLKLYYNPLKNLIDILCI